MLCGSRTVSTHHEDRAVRVTDNALRDAPQYSTPQGTQAPATEDYDSYTEFLAEVDDLLCRVA